MHSADRLRQAVQGYAPEMLGNHRRAAHRSGPRLVPVWRREDRAEAEPPPLTDVQVDAILTRRRGRRVG